MRIAINVGNVTLEAELFDTRTARKIYEMLPIETGFNTWGDEIYFEIPVEVRLDETAKELVEEGDLGYWPTGKAFCIFFGQTPISSPGEIRPASAVNIVGKTLGDVREFKKVMREGVIRIEAVE